MALHPVDYPVIEQITYVNNFMFMKYLANINNDFCFGNSINLYVIELEFTPKSFIEFLPFVLNEMTERVTDWIRRPPRVCLCRSEPFFHSQ